MSGVVAITGVTRGLGSALATGFAERGWKVLGCGRSAAALESLRSTLGAGHELAEVDVTGPEVEPWAREATGRHGPPDLLLNNAAIINAPADLWQVSREEFRRIVEVNVVGVHSVIAAYLPAMLERGSGVVVNFSSGWGRSTSPGVAPYCATKWAIEGMTRALAQELPAGMAAVALSPGVIDTDMLRIAWGDAAAAHPGPAAWAERAVPFLTELGPEHNGQSLDVPA